MRRHGQTSALSLWTGLSLCLLSACHFDLPLARDVSTLARGDQLKLEIAHRNTNISPQKAWTPEALAYGENGNIWVSDSRNHRILEISATGNVEVFAGTETSGASNGSLSQARFHTPRGLFWDGKALWIADAGNQSVRVVNPESQQVRTARIPARLKRPIAVVKIDDWLWIAESSGQLWRWHTQNHQQLEKIADLGLHRKIRQLAVSRDQTLLLLDNQGLWTLDPQSDHPALAPSIPYRENAPAMAGFWPGSPFLLSTPFEKTPLQSLPGTTLTTASPPAHPEALPVDTSALQPQLRYPGAVTGNAQGDLIVADVGTQALYRLTRNAEDQYQASVLARSGSQGFGERQDNEDLTLPHGLIYLPDKKVLWVADYYHHRILEIDAQGTARPLFEDHEPRLSFPAGFVRQPDGSIFISASGSHQIFRYHHQTLTVFAGSGQRGLKDGDPDKAEFWLPWGLSNDSEGNLYVADHGNHAIRKISPTGKVSTLAGNGRPGFANGKGEAARFHHPVDILRRGHQLLISDSWNHQIRTLNLNNNQVSTYAGRREPGLQEGSRTKAQFYCPSGLSEGPGGSLLIADTWNHRIRQMSDRGQISTLAGQGRYYNWNSGDEDGAEARFHQPRDMVYDSQSGRIFVADTANHSIRVITP